MQKKIHRHDIALVSGVALFAGLLLDDLAASAVQLIPAIPAPIHDDLVWAAAIAAILGGFVRWAVHPLRETLLHGYQLRVEHEAEARAAGAEAKVVRIPPRAYSGQLVPPLDLGPRHRAPSRTSRIPAPKRPR